MTLNDFNRKVDTLKREPIYKAYIVGLDPKDIINACRAWMNTPVRFIPAEGGSDNPWMYTEFDLDRFSRMANCKTPGMFKFLANANVIYPDGTYNEGIIKEVGNGKRKRGKKTGDNGGSGDGKVREEA